MWWPTAAGMQVGSQKGWSSFWDHFLGIQPSRVWPDMGMYDETITYLSHGRVVRVVVFVDGVVRLEVVGEDNGPAPLVTGVGVALVQQVAIEV